MGNRNGKASVIVKDREEDQVERQLTKEWSSELQDDKNVEELVDSEEKDTRRARSNPGLRRNIPKAIEGEQVAAGWPAWLSAVAGEAINGWVPRKATSFEKLEKIGDGSYSSVYKARDLMHNRTVALKKVRIDVLEPESVKFMAREIQILRRLDHPNVIKLDGLVTSRMSASLYLVFEYMEYDLTGLASVPDNKFTEAQVKCFMHQLLCGLEHCHNRGVLHRDIKCSNLLINNDGILKIADFGLSTFFDPHRPFPLTSRVVTLWYRPPELLLGVTNYGVEVDLWSTGCVLGELCTGKPIMPGKTEVEQLHKIYKLCGSPSDDLWRKFKLPHATIFKPQQPYRQLLGETFKYFPDVTIRLLETLLSLDPESRGTASLALKSEFFTTKPYACDPSSLPKYPPNKAIGGEVMRPKAPIRFFASDATAELTGPKQHGRQKANKVRFPNPAFAPSEDVSQMLEEHDRHIQEVTRQVRFEKTRADKVQSQQILRTANPVGLDPLIAPSFDVGKTIEEHDRHRQEAARRKDVGKQKVGKFRAPEDRPSVNQAGSGPSLVSTSNVDQILEEHDRHIQESFQRAMLEKKRGIALRLKDANNKALPSSPGA